MQPFFIFVTFVTVPKSFPLRYFIYGMQDEQNLERVILDFEKFNIPMADKKCHDGYLKVREISARKHF